MLTQTQPQSSADRDPHPTINLDDNPIYHTLYLPYRLVERALEAGGLTVSQYITLAALSAAGPPLTMSTLARTTDHGLATMTGIVNRLVKANYVRRVANPDDRRQVLVETLMLGRVIVGHAHKVLRELEATNG